MSNNSNGKYEKLLKYLEHHENDVALKKETKKKKEKRLKEEKEVTQASKDQIKKFTMEMMKETEVFSYVPAHGKKNYPTEGFNIRLLEEKLIKKMVEKHKKLQSYERPYISVSEVLNCLRGCYYYRKKYSIDLNKKFNYPFLYIKQKVGDSVHEAIQEVYNFDEVEKTIISEKFNVKGRADGIKEIYIIDFKPSDILKDKVDIKHYDQGNIYATILNTEYGYSIEKVVIVYYILNFKDMQVFVNGVDIKRGLSFLKNGKLLKEHLDNNVLIDPIGATESECRYCSYLKYCEKDGYKEVKPPKFKHIIEVDEKPKKEIEKPKQKIEKPVKKKKKVRIDYKDPSDGFLL